MTFGGSIADTIGSEADVGNFFDQNVSITDDTATEGAYTGKIEETATSGEIIYVVDEDGNTTTKFSTSTVADSTKELAALNAMAWRTELSMLTDRMGAIRTRPSDLGAWARYNGGKLSKDDAWGELKMNTVELGFDMPVGQSSWVLGASFSYGDGDGEFEAGMTDNKKYTLGLYATYMNDSGCFLDIMAKIDQVQSDFNLLPRPVLPMTATSIRWVTSSVSKPVTASPVIRSSSNRRSVWSTATWTANPPRPRREKLISTLSKA